MRLIESSEDLHQRGLAGPVLAKQRYDLTGIDLEVNVIEGHDARESLCDPFHFENWRQHSSEAFELDTSDHEATHENESQHPKHDDIDRYQQPLTAVNSDTDSRTPD